MTERHEFFALNQAAAYLQENVTQTLSAADKSESAKNIFILRDSTKNDDKIYLLSASKLKSIDDEVRKILTEFHAARPTEEGIPVSELRVDSISKLKQKLSIKEIRLLLQTIELNAVDSWQGKRDSIIFDAAKDCVYLSGFTPKDDKKHQEQISSILALCKARAFQPPSIEEIQEELKCDAKNLKLTVESMKNRRDISVVSGLILSREIEEKLLAVINEINGEITLAAVRDATKSSRKYILPMLEYFDAKGITRRVGEIRILRRGNQ